MKKIFFTSFIILFFILISLAVILSTVGLETNKFNKFISDKIVKYNSDISLKLEKIKFKFDIKTFNLFLETEDPKLDYQSLDIPVQNIKVYLNFISLIKSKPKIDKIDIKSKSININQLKRIMIKTKPSSLNSLITNRVKKGNFFINSELYFDENLNFNNFILKGKVKDMDAIINDNLILRNAGFNFFADASDILISKIKGGMDGISVKSGNLQIINEKEITIKSDFSTIIGINKTNISNYLGILKNVEFIRNETNLKANLDNFLNITFDKTFKVKNFTYTNTGKINEFNLKFSKPIKNVLLEEEIKDLYLKDSEFKTRYSSDKKNNISAKGKYSFDDQKYYTYNLKNNFFENNSNIDINFKYAEVIKLDFINYKKNYEDLAEVFLRFSKKKDLIDLKELKYVQDKNLILVEKLKIKKNNIISLKKIQVKTFTKNDLKNDFTIILDKKIKITGSKYDAQNLNKFLSKKSKKNILQKISKEIDIEIKNIDTPLSKKLANFRLIGVIKNGKFVKISSKGDFGENKYLDISMKNDKKNKKQYLEIYSDLPQPLLSDYSFFKGLSDGVLTFSSVIETNASTSKLVIEKFKVVNAPGVVKLLSLADFGGLSDLAAGEGLSFEKMEINMDTNNKGFLKLNELYAVGPSISVLMEGYKDENGLTSLRGTLVPAKNLNKLLSKIPVIGKIIIPEEVGEGLFGVSFKMKGMPGKMKTTINPIKTLTPRFITKVLERSKETK